MTIWSSASPPTSDSEALPQAHTLKLTEVHADLSGDVHFPLWDRGQLIETATTSPRERPG